MKTLNKYWFAGIVLATIFAAFPARADNDALMQLIEVLHDNGTINDEAYEKLRAAIALDEEDEPVATDKPVLERAAETAEDPDPPARVDFAGRKLRIESADGQFGFRLGGRIMTDAAHYDEDINTLGSGTELRRVRLAWDGTLSRDWAFKGEIEFAGGADLKSTYLDYVGLPDTYFRFGKYKEPISMEELSSSKYTTFMERAMLTELLPGRNVGLGAGRSGERWGLSAGLFAGLEDGEEEQDEGLALSGRFHYAPWHRPRHSAHLGVSASYRDMGDSQAIRFRARPDSHITDTRLVDTGVVEGVDNVAWLGLEAALVADSLSLQSEYLAVGLDRFGLSDPRFQGWYAYGSWFLTGESRSYDPRDGSFGRITPQRPFGGGGPGAIELGLRFSRLDLTDEEVIGGVQDNLNLGLNWYPTPNVRFMANYIKVLELDRPGSEFDGDTPSIFQIRGQADF
jgi:phosphate-selective porin OprO and OprP